MANIDSLEIQILASAKNANQELDKLVAKLNNVSVALGSTSKSANSLNRIKSNFKNLSNTIGNTGTVSQNGFNKLNNGLLLVNNSLKKSSGSAKSFVSTFTRIATTLRIIKSALNGLENVIAESVNYLEVLNYYNRAWEQVADKADLSSFEELGYESAEIYANSFAERASELTAKMTGFNIDTSGTLEATGGASLGINPTALMNYQAMFGQMASSIGTTSEQALMLSNALTMIGADLASVKNMDFEKVWHDMASGLAGMSRTLDKYGVNIRNVNLQEKLHELGINANIQALNQYDKALLRVIILLDSTRYAWGDLSETINQPANQLRLLQANFTNLARTIGNLFLPIVSSVLPYINGLVIALQRLFVWVGSLAGLDLSNITSSVGGGGASLDDILGTDEAEEGINGVSNAVKKLKTHLLGIDELNVISEEDTSAGGSLGGIGSGLLDDAFLDAYNEYMKAWEEAFAGLENKANEIADRIVNAFKSGDFEGIGEFIGMSIANALDSIDWQKVYEVTTGFFKGLAEFWNGLISPELFSEIGQTIASALNTVIYSQLSFGTNFDFVNLGESIASGINSFFNTFDFEAFAETINVWVQGIWNTITTAIGNIEWETVWDKAKEFLQTLDFETLALGIGLLSLKFIDLKSSISSFASLLNGSDLKDGLSNTETALLGSVDATISWKTELDGLLLLLKDLGVTLVAFGLVQEPLKDGFLDLLGSTTDTKDVTDEMKESYNGLGGTIQGFKDVLSFFENTINSLPGVMSGAEYAGRAMAIAFEEIANGTIYTDEQLAKMQERWGLTEDDIESLRQEMLDANPALRDLADSFGLFDTSVETLSDISTGMSLLTDGTVLATEAFDEFSKPMWAMTEEAQNFFAEIQNGNISLEDYRTELGNVSDSLTALTEDMKTAGDNIADGLLEGMENADTEKTAQGFFDSLTLGISNVFGIHSPAENMKPLGEYILLGIVEGFVGYYSEFTNAITTWWDEYVAPWFTEEQWQTLFETIKTSLSTKWNETVEDWKSKIKDWWEKHVKTWFKSEDWKKLLDVIPDSFEDAFNTAKEWVSSKLQEIYDTVSGWVSNIKSKIEEIKSAFSGLGGLGSATLGVNVALNGKGYATGGFPNSADIFYANENGVPELVGTIGSRTAVASGTEITGISDAVYRTGADQSMLLQNAVGLLQTSIGLLQDIADKELTIGDRDIARASARGQRSMGYTLITEG